VAKQAYQVVAPPSSLGSTLAKMKNFPQGYKKLHKLMFLF
jgi:hypothetical protein